MSIREESVIEKLADESPDLPIGVAFLDKSGIPIWPDEGATYQVHHPVVVGWLPKIS